MTYLVAKPFTIETPQGSVTLPTGKVLELSEDQAAQLGNKVRLAEGENKQLPHYCEPGDCCCSEKLPCSNYPAGCARINCEHHHALQEAAQAVIEAQGILRPAQTRATA